MASFLAWTFLYPQFLFHVWSWSIVGIMLLEKQLLQSEDGKQQSSRKRVRSSVALRSQETVTWIELSRQVFQHFSVLWLRVTVLKALHLWSLAIFKWHPIVIFFSLFGMTSRYYLLLSQKILENQTLTIVTGCIGHWVTMMFFEEFLLDILVPNPLPKKHWKQKHVGTSRKL